MFLLKDEESKEGEEAILGKRGWRGAFGGADYK
jgi:hypothetical protein